MKRDTKYTKNNETYEKPGIFRMFRYFSYISCLSSSLPTKSDVSRNPESQLVVPKRYQRIDLSRPPCRNVAGDECDNDKQQSDADESSRIGRAHTEEQILQHASQSQSGSGSYS